MPLLSGAVSATRFQVVSLPAEPDFDAEAFREIAPGSEVRESIGFVPFEPGASWVAGTRRFAARVRLDKLAPDPTAVRERFRDLLQVEREESGVAQVNPKKRRELKALAEEELIVRATPRSRIVETVVDGDVLHVATTANLHLGKILSLYRRIGVIADFKTPWNDLGEPDAESEILDLGDPMKSAHGARFLRDIIEDPEIRYEPVGGYVTLQTRYARVTLTGAILRDLYRYLEEDSEITSAKLITQHNTFRLDGLTFRLSGCNLENSRHDHWIECLDERLERLDAVWDLLDRRYAETRRGASAKKRPSVTHLRLLQERAVEAQREREPGDDDANEAPPPDAAASEGEVPF